MHIRAGGAVQGGREEARRAPGLGYGASAHPFKSSSIRRIALGSECLGDSLETAESAHSNREPIKERQVA